MEEYILEEVRRDVFEHPKPTIDLDYLYSVKRQIQEFADHTNSQLKKNVYQNYSLFIESSREISTLKEEMKQLNTLLEHQQSSMNKLLEQLNKTPIIQPNLERPKEYIYNIPTSEISEIEAETFPSWYTKSPEDFDVLIAQRNLIEAVELAQNIKKHFQEFPAVSSRPELKSKIDNRIQELITVISSELQPATDRTVQGGPRSSINSIQLLRKLNLSSRAAQLYLDQRSSVLRFRLEQQQKIESTTTRQLCTIFFQNTIETCSEFKQAFEINKNVRTALKEFEIYKDEREIDNDLIFNLITPTYLSAHPSSNDGSPSHSNGNDIASKLFTRSTEKIAMGGSSSGTKENVFYHLSTYALLTNWIVQEFEFLIELFKKNVFNSQQVSVSTIADSVYCLKNQCKEMAKYCGIDLQEFMGRKLAEPIEQVVKDRDRRLQAEIRKLDNQETWEPQQFQNKVQLDRFLKEMEEVGLNTMQKYTFADLKLKFTACKTSFARYYLLTVGDLAKLVDSANKSRIDDVLMNGFLAEMSHIVDSLKKVRSSHKSKPSEVRFIMGNSNFLLDKVLVVAQEQYTTITGLQCNGLRDLQEKYNAIVKSVAEIK